MQFCQIFHTKSKYLFTFFWDFVFSVGLGIVAAKALFHHGCSLLFIIVHYCFIISSWLFVMVVLYKCTSQKNILLLTFIKLYWNIYMMVCSSYSSSEYVAPVKPVRGKHGGKLTNGTSHNARGKRKKKRASYLSAYEGNFKMDAVDDRKPSKRKSRSSLKCVHYSSCLDSKITIKSPCSVKFPVFVFPGTYQRVLAFLFI